MIRIEQEIIDQPDVERLFNAADAATAALYPGQHRPGPTTEALIACATRFFVARIDGRAAGCAGFAPGPDGCAELKRVFVDPAARGQSIGRGLVLATEALAANERFPAMRLETGRRAEGAIRLYRRLGYQDRPPYGPYAGDPHSMFMEKTLGAPAQTRYAAPMTLKPAEHYPAMADPQAQPRYVGIPTFFRAPHTQDLADCDIGLIGVPFDGGVTNRPGARHGPREVRNQSSLLRPVSTATDQAPFASLRIRDLGDCWIERPYALEGALAEIEAYYHRIVDAGVTPVSVGGDHSIAWPILRAVAKHGPVGMVHIDAHGDTGDDYMGSRFHHGAPFRRAMDDGLLDPARVIQIGLRGTSTVRGSLWAFSESSGMRVMPMDELHDRGWRWAVEEARRVIGAGPAYLSFDIDSLDPVYAPGTGTPEAGGLTTIEAQRIIRGLTGLNIVGADVVEVSPPFDHAGLTAFHGASMLFEILCVVAAARVARAN